jgi:hypothetical protein
MSVCHESVNLKGHVQCRFKISFDGVIYSIIYDNFGEEEELVGLNISYKKMLSVSYRTSVDEFADVGTISYCESAVGVELTLPEEVKYIITQKLREYRKLQPLA